MKSSLPLLSVAMTATFFSCHKPDFPGHPGGYPDKAAASGATVLTTNNAGVKVYHGGYGSALAKVPFCPDQFYLLTDRGPNADGASSDTKVFPVPDFNPQIGQFRLQGDSLVLINTIHLKTATGKYITGLVNPPGMGNSGEIGIDMNGNTLPYDPEGMDSEGMAVAFDGTIWISDEYGPHLLHISKDGTTIERINPFGTGKGGRKIPAVFAKRRANRGMEGLTITPDGKYLVGMMQSPLYNPSKSAVSGSLVTRILVFEILTGKTKQYLYKLENKNTANSEIAAIDNNNFLVLERDQLFPGDPVSPAQVKRVYKISLENATDVSDPSNGTNGKLVNGKTLEELSDAELAAAGINTVSKWLTADLLTDVKDYPHDKAEGLTIISNSLIAVSNDDDFGITPHSPADNTFIQKILPLTHKTDFNSIYFIKLKTPLTSKSNILY